MTAKGGVPVLHGWSHQYRNATGDDYEFWDDLENHAIPGDSEAEVRRRITDGVAECVANGIFPIGFETPHYAASAIDYRAMAKIFRLFYERDMVHADVNSIQYFPYTLTDAYGRFIVPENLGYLPAENPDPKVLISNARAMRVVRDGIASFYFHPFLPPDLLAQTVDGITTLGYTFVSLRQFGGGFDSDGRQLMQTTSGPVNLQPTGEYWRLRRFGAKRKPTSEPMSAPPPTPPQPSNPDLPPAG